MKTKIKRHSRSVMSVVLALCMLVSCMTVGIIATDAARVNSDEVGTNYYLFISTDNNPASWTKYVTSSSQTFTVTPSDLNLSNFATGTNYYVGISSSTSYTGMWSQTSNGSAVVGTVTGAGISGTSANQYNVGDVRYNFAHISFSSSSVESLTVTVTHDGGDPGTTTYSFATSGNVENTWTAVGDNTALFGTAWAPTATANDMTTTDDNIYTWTKSNVALSAGTILYKVVQNHSWNNTSYPSSNASKTVSTAGNYNVTITYNNTSHAVDMTLTAATVTESTLSVASVANATVTATYDGTTAQEGGSISDVPEGATVTISVTPDSGYKCSGVTSSDGGTVSGSGSAWTLTMPGNDTTISATTAQATKRKVYFNNYYTRYSMVSAYAWNGTADQSSITDEPLGTWPGVTMTRITNTNTWEIELYDDTQYIIFRGDDGYNTYVDTNSYYHITIPWSTQSNAPKYTAGSDKTSPTTNGTWGTYVARSNDYTVTAGSTLSASGIYSAINATFFDYYVDNEVTGGWLTGITAEADYKCSGDTNDPYRNKLNSALSTYASNNSVTYPLYFGNNKSSNSSGLTNFNQRANNADGLSPDTTAIYGLAGNTLTNSTINHYSSSGTNYNGAAMAMFDEDFLSGENSQGTALASILHSSNFPVRETTKNVLVLDLSGASNASTTWESASAIMVANFYTSSTSSGNKYVLMTSLGNHKYSVEIPDGYTKVQWLRRNPANDTTWNSKDAGAFGSNNKYSVTTIGTDWNSVTGSWTTDSTYSAGHTYYEYDSTDGKDNAFITDITQGSTAEERTAQINYYPQSAGKTVKSQNNKIGFFPFDYNNIIAGETYDTSTIYVDVSSVSGASYYGAYLWHSGQAGTWTTLTQHSGNIYKFDNSAGYDYVILTRAGTEANAKNFDSSWNRTGDVTIPTGSDNKTTIKLTYNSSTYNGRGMDWSHAETSGIQPVEGNGYAESSHLAHDQGFGVKLEIPFTLGANGLNEDGTAQTFDFSGDDDLWVYVDDQLILDLGGAHNATTGSINFNTKKATAQTAAAVASGNGTTHEVSFTIDNSASAVNTVHTMTIYYMERGMFDSNLKFGFSFHAIPNLLNVDKKVRTANVNSGFFDATSSNTATDENGTAYQNSQGKNITQFEHTYQGDYVSTDTGVTVPSGETLKTETFGITQGSSTAPGSGSITYSISSNSGSNSTTVSSFGSGNTFNYDLYNDWVAYFNGQYDEGQNITLKETIPSDSLYKYDQSFEVTNITDNNSSVSYSGDSSSGYSFNMPTTSGSGLNDLRVRARFTNQMKTHDLTISKDLNADDSTTPFTIQVLFKFGNYDYTPYRLYCVVDGANTQMDADGKITLRKNHTVTIKGIPENAQVQIKEILSDDTYAYNSTTLTGSAESQTNVAYGKQFTMGEGDVAATVRNTLGALTITHDLHTNTEGFGTCYASAKVKNGSTDVYSYAETAGALEISPEYIKYNSTYSLEITLRTVPANSATVMDSFWEQVTSDALAELTSSSNLGLSATVTVDKSNYTATITFPIAKLFDSTTQVQNVTNMPFYSKLATWKWRMIFDVLSYRGLYNNMQYVTDTVPFTESEWSQMTTTTSGANEEGQTVNNIPDFTSKDARDAFIYAHAPYENGFKTNMTWNTALKSSTNKESDMAIKIKESTRTITYIVKGSSSASDPVYVKFELPYTTSYSKGLVADKDANDDVEKTTDHISYGERNDAWRTAFGGHYTISSKYIQAPQKILVSGSKTDNSDTRVYKYFSYWEVYTQPTDKTSRTLYTKCYSQTFNLTLYQDSVIKAVYNNDSYVSPSQMALNDDNAATGGGTASINFMENSRTQWTKDSDTLKIAATSGGNVPDSYHKGGDRIYTDFLISFTYNDLQLNTSTNTGLTPGLIVETVGDLPINTSTGLYEEKSQQYYQDNYSSSEDVNAVKTFIANTSSKSSGNLLKSEFTLAELDNKNRLNYYYSLPNISHSSLEPTVRKNKVYRAYAYLRNASGAVVVSNPVYYSIYDIATIANYADGRGYDGVTS